MKKPLNLTIALVSIIMTAVSCSSPQEARIRDRVESQAKAYPIHIAEGISIDTLTYSDNVLTYYATVDSPMMPLDVLADKQEVIKPLLIQMIRSSVDPEVIEQIEMCRQAETSICFILNDGSTKLRIDLPSAEL